MASKKTKTKPSKKTSKKKVSSSRHPISLITVVGLFLAGVLAGGGLFLLNAYFAHKPVKPIKPIPIEKFKPPKFEIFPTRTIAKKTRKIPRPKAGMQPMVSIIIDDMGYDRHLCEKFIRLKAPITCSILPESPYHVEIAKYAHKMGKCIMLHLPMEPIQYPAVNPGPGALLSSMPPDTITRVLKQDLALVPYISGVNNHMGSRLTADSDKMNQVLLILKTKGLFFIDSRTTAKSKARSAARLFKVPFAERDVFLDNVASKDRIKKQLEKLIRIAKKNGTAIGIGHPHKATLDAISEMLPQMKKETRLVYASELVYVPSL